MLKVKEPVPKTGKLQMRVAWVLIAAGAAGLAVGGILLTKGPKPPATVTVAAAPSSAKPAPKEIDAYTVAPDLPKYLSIPSIKVEKARVRGLGLKDGQIASPANIYDTGWYNASARPGQAGAMFVFGHVSSWTANGIFHDLKKLKPGDRVAVTRGDDTVFIYQVVGSKVYPGDDVDMNAVLSPVDAAKPGLNLMTCSGSVMKGTNQFSERLVVFTKLVS